ncbi:unnamed protein product [Gongylonema pulchrum]|uniref:ATPase domain-containing protein n=1 Tax=Gongylonema pulchrum TaxID=637853 RepID=A0A183EVM4_9BILA|nr:unnamed protein product [Gongylonema pulchrum]
MLAEIDRLLAGPPAAGVIGIVSEDLSAPDFLLMSITSYAMKRQIKVIYLSATRNEHAVRIMANKLMIRLSDKMRYVSLCQCLPDGFISSGESFCMQLLQKIEEQIEQNDKEVFILFDNFTAFCDLKIEEQIEQNDKEVFILFDNFTAFCDLVGLPSIVPTFIRRLQQLVFDKNAEPLLVK